MNKPHKNLFAWQKSMDLVEKVFGVTTKFPTEERFTLVPQMRRCAYSAPSNIAEGASDRSHKDFAKYLGISLGSLNELSTQTEIAFRLGFINENEFDELESSIDECLRLIYGLRKSVRKKIN